MSVYPIRPWPSRPDVNPVEQSLWYLDRVSHLVYLATGEEVSETWTRHQDADCRTLPWTHIVSWWQTSTATPVQVSNIQGTVLGKCHITWGNGLVSLTIDPGMPDQEFVRRVRAVTEMLETATWL